MIGFVTEQSIDCGFVLEFQSVSDSITIFGRPNVALPEETTLSINHLDVLLGFAIVRLFQVPALLAPVYSLHVRFRARTLPSGK